MWFSIHAWTWTQKISHIPRDNLSCEKMKTNKVYRLHFQFGVYVLDYFNDKGTNIPPKCHQCDFPKIPCACGRARVAWWWGRPSMPCAESRHVVFWYTLLPLYHSQLPLLWRMVRRFLESMTEVIFNKPHETKSKMIQNKSYTFIIINENLKIRECFPRKHFHVYVSGCFRKKSHGVYKGEVKVCLFSKFPSRWTGFTPNSNTI